VTDEPSSRYRLLSSLGKGGMDEVFLADDTQLGRKVALKFLPEALEADDRARAMLGDAIARFKKIGMSWHLEQAEHSLAGLD